MAQRSSLSFVQRFEALYPETRLRLEYLHPDRVYQQVLDEPTAALGVAEVRKVIDFVRKIKQSGRACIYIEHNLAHVHEVADRLVVLDRGRVVSQINPKDMTVAELTEYLIGLQHKDQG